MPLSSELARSTTSYQGLYARVSSARRLVLAFALLGWGASGAVAQTDLPPRARRQDLRAGHAAGLIKETPAPWSGSYRPAVSSDLSAMAHFGIQKDLFSPVIGIAALQVEGYIGVTGRELNGGGRLLFKIPSLHFSLGPDYDVESDEFDLLLRLELATRAVGIFGRATMLRIDYLPGRQNTIMVGVDVPLWGKNLGKTRPRRDAVKLAQRPLGPGAGGSVHRPASSP